MSLWGEHVERGLGDLCRGDSPGAEAWPLRGGHSPLRKSVPNPAHAQEAMCWPTGWGYRKYDSGRTPQAGPRNLHAGTTAGGPARLLGTFASCLTWISAKGLSRAWGQTDKGAGGEGQGGLASSPSRSLEQLEETLQSLTPFPLF